MKHIKSILVPTDFSSTALNAYGYALQLADAFGASIDLLHAVPLLPNSPEYAYLVSDLPHPERGSLEAFLGRGIARFGQHLGRTPLVRTFVKSGGLRATLRAHVAEHGNQLIIIGTAARYPGWDEILGSNASSLVSRAPCPVLVVPQNALFKPIESMCFATDLHDTGTFLAGRVQRALRPFRPKLCFLHIRTADHESTDYDMGLLCEMFHRPELGMHASFASRKAEDMVGAIFDYSVENSCDLVVMQRPDRPWFRRLLVKSNTGAAVINARLPLLIIPVIDLIATDAVAADELEREANAKHF
ncbi:MAG: universal stress protein [Lewinella sp.]